MSLNKLCGCKGDSGFGLLLVRIGVGVVFAVHGYQKLTNVGGTVGFFDSLGVPTFLAYLVIIVELLGGLAMIVGFLTKYAGILLAIIMAVAIVLVHLKQGLVGGYEFPLVLLFSSLGIAFAGAGKYSLHAKLCGGKKCSGNDDEKSVK